MYEQLFNLFHLLKQPRQFVHAWMDNNVTSCLKHFHPLMQEYLPLEEEIIQYKQNDKTVYDFYLFN